MTMYYNDKFTFLSKKFMFYNFSVLFVVYMPIRPHADHLVGIEMFAYLKIVKAQVTIFKIYFFA